MLVQIRLEPDCWRLHIKVGVTFIILLQMVKLGDRGSQLDRRTPVILGPWDLRYVQGNGGTIGLQVLSEEDHVVHFDVGVLETCVV